VTPRKRTVRAAPPSTPPPPAPVVVRRPHPVAWQEALRLADGDHSRLAAQPDGSVVVR
jgi:hypothetical protein